jgi:hypothetical protein
MADIPVIAPPEQDSIPAEVTVWYKNSTLIANAFAAIVLILTNYCGITVPTELQVSIMTVINIALQAPKMAGTQAKAVARNMETRARLFRKN